MSTLTLLESLDYRAYLKCLYLDLKKKHGKYSYRQFSADTGFGTTNYLHLVINGKRNLSLEGIDKFKKCMPWSNQEKNYFHTLVLFNQAVSDTEKSKFSADLNKILRKKKIILNPDQFSYFSTWYIPVIREIVALRNYVSNLNWISRKLKPTVTEEQVKSALGILERLKMIVKQSGKWIQNQQHITTDSELTSNMVHNYHKEMLRLSLGALSHPAESRDISAMTMSLSLRQYQWLKQRIIEFRDEIQQELQEMPDEHTMVGQLNIQLFQTTEL